MRIAVLTGIHANLDALDAVLAVLPQHQIDQIIVLGDFFGYGAEPWETYLHLEAAGARMIMGDQEAGVTETLPLGWFPELPRAAVRWTREQLVRPQIERIKRLPGMIIEPPALFLPGGIIDQYAEMLDKQEICQNAMIMRRKYDHCYLCFHGQTHLANVWQVRGDWDAESIPFVRNEPLSLSADTIWFVGVGSVGQPRGSGTTDAQWVIYDSEAITIELRQTPYDVNAAAQKILATGQPKFFADRLFAKL